MLKEDYKIYEGKMKKSIDSVAADFASVRAGRANASVLDRIMVDYYGSPHPADCGHLFPRRPDTADFPLGQDGGEEH